MSQLFLDVNSGVPLLQAAAVFNENVATWDVSHVKDMRETFYNASVFDQDLGGW